MQPRYREAVWIFLTCLLLNFKLSWVHNFQTFQSVCIRAYCYLMQLILNNVHIYVNTYFTLQYKSNSILLTWKATAVQASHCISNEPGICIECSSSSFIFGVSNLIGWPCWAKQQLAHRTKIIKANLRGDILDIFWARSSLCFVRIV